MRWNVPVTEPLRILDTDHVSLLQRGHPRVMARTETVPDPLLAVTIVTYEEQVRGRLGAIRSAKDMTALVKAYDRLQETLTYFCARKVLPFDDAARAEFSELKKLLRHVGTQDLKIAAIALSVEGILVTRNRADFEQIPDLVLEDWSV